MQAPVGVTVIIMWATSLALADDAGPQTSIGETLSGPDSHETGQGLHGHLLGDWAVFGRTCSNEVSGSISNTSAILSQTSPAIAIIALLPGIASEELSTSILVL